MATSFGQISALAEEEAVTTKKSFADRMARSLRAKSKKRKDLWEQEAAAALSDMADAFEMEGWKN